MRRWRTVVAIGMGIVVLAGCSSSGSDAGGDDADPTTTAADALDAETTTTTEEAPTTSVADTPDALPDCQELLTEYAEVFTFDDLLPAAAFFRRYAPLMPAEVGDAVIRLAEEYERIDGDATQLNMGDVDLTADAQVFSDWTNDGCPPG